MNNMAKTIVAPLALAILFSGACIRNNHSQANTSELWSDNYSLEIGELLRIGTDDLEDDRYVFSGINDIETDTSNNIYVLDRKEFRIQVYSKSGDYTKTIKLLKGQGPGDFMRALRFDIDEENRIYIIDDYQRRVTAFDQDGKLIGSMPLAVMPGAVAAGKNNDVFIVSGLLNNERYEINKYSFPDGRLLASFCNTNKTSITMNKVGGNGEISIDPFGQIIFAFFAPDDIHIYSQEGKFIRGFFRFIPSFRPPKTNELGLPDMPVMTKAIGAFPDGKILHVSFDTSSKPYVNYFDIYDRNGNWLLGFNTNQYLTGWQGRNVEIDRDGNLIIESWVPFPQVVKYGFRIERRGD